MGRLGPGAAAVVVVALAVLAHSRLLWCTALRHYAGAGG